MSDPLPLMLSDEDNLVEFCNPERDCIFLSGKDTHLLHGLGKCALSRGYASKHQSFTWTVYDEIYFVSFVILLTGENHQ